MKLVTLNPDQIVLTNLVSNESPGWWGFERDFLEGIQTPPVIVSPVYKNGRRRVYIVLDGNHRACMCAHHSQPIKAWVVLNDSDADKIIDLESESKIPNFPHRKFLGGSVTLKELIDEAIQAATRMNQTVAQVLARINDLN